jgi:uncharacterized RmlC-like cupin family protein
MSSKPGSGAETSPRIVTVRADEASDSKQALPLFFGVSGRSAGAKGISMYKIVIPPGAAAEPHCHKDFETAIYVIKGRVETRFGPGLRDSVVNGPGDFVYIPPDLPHQPVNLSDSEPAEAIVARNDPSEQENVVPYDPDAN